MSLSSIYVTETEDEARPVGRCLAAAAVLSGVSDKWSMLIVMLLGDGPKRFNELKRLMGGISQRMLTLKLRSFERDGLVTRTQYPTIPPRVEYELTSVGCSLRMHAQALGAWAAENYQTITQARTAFDARSDGRASWSVDTQIRADSEA